MIKMAQRNRNRSLGTESAIQGFTIVELITVIILLGILSAVALPKFINISAGARIATLESLEGAIHSATGMVHAQALLEGKTDCSTDPTIEMEGEIITLRCGYPCPHPGGIGRAVTTNDNYVWVGGNCSGQQGAIEVRISDAPDPNNCRVRYVSARSNRPPSISLLSGGC